MKKTPLNKVSKKGAKRNASWMKAKLLQLTNFPMCALHARNRATEVHHIFGKLTVDLLINPLNLVSLETACHKSVEFENVKKVTFLIFDFMIIQYGQTFIDFAEKQQDKLWREYVEEKGI